MTLGFPPPGSLASERDCRDAKRGSALDEETHHGKEQVVESHHGREQVVESVLTFLAGRD